MTPQGLSTRTRLLSVLCVLEIFLVIWRSFVHDLLGISELCCLLRKERGGLLHYFGSYYLCAIIIKKTPCLPGFLLDSCALLWDGDCRYTPFCPRYPASHGDLYIILLSRATYRKYRDILPEASRVKCLAQGHNVIWHAGNRTSNFLINSPTP